MSFTYRLAVEEDLDRLDVPQPSEEEVRAAWAEQSSGPLPPTLAPHVRAALRTQWLAKNRGRLLTELDATLRWANDNVGWRALLDDPTVTDILVGGGYEGLHSAFYSEHPDTWFGSATAAARVAFVCADPRAETLPAIVRESLDALGRGLTDCARFGLRFRFDFCP